MAQLIDAGVLSASSYGFPLLFKNSVLVVPFVDPLYRVFQLGQFLFTTEENGFC